MLSERRRNKATVHESCVLGRVWTSDDLCLRRQLAMCGNIGRICQASKTAIVCDQDRQLSRPTVVRSPSLSSQGEGQHWECSPSLSQIQLPALSGHFLLKCLKAVAHVLTLRLVGKTETYNSLLSHALLWFYILLIFVFFALYLFSVDGLIQFF